MARLHPSEFLGGDGCKMIDQEFDEEFDLFVQGVQLAEKRKLQKMDFEMNFLCTNDLWNISQILSTYFAGKMKFPL